MTNIEWTNETWNPIVGCTKVSEGCRNCYAEIMANRLAGMERERFKNFSNEGDKSFDWKYTNVIEDGKWNGKTHFVESALYKPLKWKKPRMIFVCSMSDLFHETVSFEDIIRVFEIIEKTPQHTYQILTKRPEIASEFFKKTNRFWHLQNVWFGITAENQKLLLERWKYALINAFPVRFISHEPSLAQLNILELEIKPDWIICGGESGHKARPMHPDWARNLATSAKNAQVPFFFKQWGEWLLVGQIRHTPLTKINKLTEFKNGLFCKLGKKKAGRLLDGKEHNEMPNLKL